MLFKLEPDKTDATIRMILPKLCPSIDITTLKLPRKSCAKCMCREDDKSGKHLDTNEAESGGAVLMEMRVAKKCRLLAVHTRQPTQPLNHKMGQRLTRGN